VKITMPGASREEQASAVKLANAAVLLSQGIPFLEGGVEIGRDKGGDRNTYNKDDLVNGYHWEHANEYKGVHAYLRGLIALRRQLGALRLPDAGQIKRNVQVWAADRLPAKAIAYELAGMPGGVWKQLLVVLHGSRDENSIDLPTGEWDVLVDGEHAGVKPMRAVRGRLTLTPLSAFVVARPKSNQ
jgi:pullulanase